MIRSFLFGIAASASLGLTEVGMAFDLDYDDMVFLDAESLAELGIQEAYESLLPALRRYVPEPDSVEEIIDNNAPSYTVIAGGKSYPVHSPDSDSSEGRSWGRATYVFFEIVNRQLSGSTHRFYAFYGGNDLGGMFLTPDDAKRGTESLPRRTDWPYLPTMDHPWYGQPH